MAATCRVVKLIYMIVVCMFACTESALEEYGIQQTTATNNTPKYRLSEQTCFLKAESPLTFQRVRDLVELKVKLIEYELVFNNFSKVAKNNTWTYNLSKWARVSQQHGQTLLSLAFNYGLLSLMTLTFGTEKLVVHVHDVPTGCVSQLDEDRIVNKIIYLLMRDFADLDSQVVEKQQVTLVEDERVCHEILKSTDITGYFTDRCCQLDKFSQELVCYDDIVNIWLTILYVLLIAVKFGMLFFGPLWFISGIEGLSKETHPYIVKLKTPLVKTIYLCTSEAPKLNYKSVLDLRRVKRFTKFKQATENIALGEPIKVKITEYHILVNYKKLLIENTVPVGITHSILRNIFQCKLKDMGPFRRCCHTNIYRSLNTDRKCLWITLAKIVAGIFIVFLIPTPLYLRLLVYYYYEFEEVAGRNEMLERLGLNKVYDGSLVHFLGPTHPMFITIYGIYFFTIMVLLLLPKKGKARFRRIVVGAFRDLKSFDWVTILEIMIGNIIWPFKRFGLLGCLLAPFYWSIVMPITLVGGTLYCLPSIYLTFRFLFYMSTPGAVFGNVRNKMRKGAFRIEKRVDMSLGILKADMYEEKAKEKDDEEPETQLYRRRESKRIQMQRFWFHLFAALLSIITMYAVLLMFSECVGFVVEIAVFTTMGVIVNAGSVLKYTILLIMVVLYSYDCYNNVGKKYLKLNKALFSEVKGRIKDLWDVTSMPSYLQENRGFKSQELDEQGEHESPDDIAKNCHMNLMINDLVLFVDSEDMPRIPEQLFHDVCTIRVAGAPGPVFRSLIDATKEFLMIVVFLLFVFIVVMSFGAVYRVSTTNQMMATLAGGFMPFLMRTFMAPSKPDIEIGTVSFKSKLDEIIQNFYQLWPMYDFPFELWTEEDEKKEEAEKEEDEECVTMDRSAQTGMIDKSVQTDAINGSANNNTTLLNNDPPYFAENANNNGKLTNMEPAANGDENDDVEEVDILIYMPSEKQDGWLQEWSDIEQYGYEADDEDVPIDAEELEAMEKDAEIENVV